MAAMRNAVLRHLQLKVGYHFPAPARTISFSDVLRRCFSQDASASFLDKSEVVDRVITVIKSFQKVDPSKVTPTAHFEKDLGLDSLDAVEVVMGFEEEFGFEISDSEADKIDSINAAVDFIASHPQAK